MNDCVYYMIGVCDADMCICGRHESVNSEKGTQIITEYEGEVEKALEPVRKQFKEKYIKGDDEDVNKKR